MARFIQVLTWEDHRNNHQIFHTGNGTVTTTMVFCPYTLSPQEDGIIPMAVCPRVDDENLAPFRKVTGLGICGYPGRRHHYNAPNVITRGSLLSGKTWHAIRISGVGLPRKSLSFSPTADGRPLFCIAQHQRQRL